MTCASLLITVNKYQPPSVKLLLRVTRSMGLTKVQTVSALICLCINDFTEIVVSSPGNLHGNKFTLRLGAVAALSL